MSIPVADVAAATEAGFFRLDSTPPHGKSSRIGQLAQGEDLAYIIATSGTTARPKLVPLTHRAACHTMSSAADALALTPADRCLNFSPLFHLLGFMSSLLLPLAGGGSSVCKPGFHLQDFFRWLDEFQPTWFCAVPAVLQEILELSSSYAAVLGHSRIRFLRTGGSPLPPSVLRGNLSDEAARLLLSRSWMCGTLFLPPLSAPHLLWVRLWRRVRRLVFVGWHWPQGLWSHFRDVLRPGTQAPLAENTQALFRHHPEPWSGRMVHIWAAEWPHGRYFDPGFGWNHLAPTGFVFHEVPGNHLTMLQEPNVAQVARILADELDRAPLIHERPQARATQAQ